MQTSLNLKIPDHTFSGNWVRCNQTTGSFNIAVWKNENIKYGICPCCNQRCKK